MPRTYKPDPHGKRYRKYDKSVIQKAVEEYSGGGSSLDIISKKYQIHKSVLYRHCTKIMKCHGGQTVLSKETEEEFIKYINICAEWGYPLEAYDLRLLVKLYLDKLGITEKRFKGNLPGPDFVASFLKRHKDVISQRISQNIKRNRAAVSPKVIKKYFEELSVSLHNVPMSNIINYDETNLADDPGRKKIITKRGTKYPERVMNHSKSAVSIMMSGTAEGELLPPYVVYKAQHLYDTWRANGPKGARYNRSQSGWFDGTIFEDWVKSMIIPYFQDKPGKKILIGDNLSSHLSIDLIKLCQEYEISFVFLPANSTHLTQPLDVAFFRPMKIAWRNIICQWKRTADGRKQSTIPKGCFPILLKNLIDHLKNNAKDNILSGFRKTGIIPFDPAQVLNRLPGNEGVSHETGTINESVLEILKDMRYGTMNIAEPKRKRKLEVEPGKSVSFEESYVETEEENIKPRKKTKKTKSQVKENLVNNNENTKLSTSKGKGVGKRTKIPTQTNFSPAEILADNKSLNENLDIQTLPIIIDNSIILQHDHVSVHEIQSVEQKKDSKIQILSNKLIKPASTMQGITNTKVTNHQNSSDIESFPIFFDDNEIIDHVETVETDSNIEIITQASQVSEKAPKTHYYKNDEEILQALMDD